jgi:neurofibromin 1
VSVYAQALTMIFRFLPEEDSLPLFEECLMPERSDAVKLCAVRACLTLVQEVILFCVPVSSLSLMLLLPVHAVTVAEGPGQPDSCSLTPSDGDFQGNFAFHAARSDAALTSPSQHGARRRAETDQNGRVQRSQAYPKIKRTVPQPLNDGEVLILGILAIWRTKPAFYFDDSDQPGKSWMDSTTKLWESSADNSVKASAIANLVLSVHAVFQTSEVTSSDGRLDILTRFLKYSL